MPVFNTINTLASAINVTGGADTTQPYSFQDWKQRNNNVTSTDFTAQYSNYVTSWYLNKGLSNAISVNYVKEYYKTFLKTLGVTARTPDEKSFFNAVDINDDISLQAAIVGYARRLKDVSVYLANKRNHVVYTKLKNNLVGTSASLERLFYNYILNAFTRKIAPDNIITTSFDITNPDILTSLPYINVIAGNFSVEIQELYDTNNYFDRDPSLSISTYNTVASGTPEAFYSAGSYRLPEEYLIAQVVAAAAEANALLMATTLPTYWTFISDGVTTTYTLSNLTSSRASDYQVSVDGVMQTPDSSYIISIITQTITFLEPPPTNNLILIVKRY
jgi:hypothetical protein